MLEKSGCSPVKRGEKGILNRDAIWLITRCFSGPFRWVSEWQRAAVEEAEKTIVESSVNRKPHLRDLLLQVWSKGRQHGPHWELVSKCHISGPASVYRVRTHTLTASSGDPRATFTLQSKGMLVNVGVILYIKGRYWHTSAQVVTQSDLSLWKSSGRKEKGWLEENDTQRRETA